MIHDVDESLRQLVLRDALNGSGAELSFDAPTKEWAARQNTPTVDFYLYDIREDVDRRRVAFEHVRDDNGRVTERRPPPRRFDLSYLVTAWTKRAEDEHRLLSSVLSSFLRFDALPEDVLQGALAEQDLPVIVSVALPLREDRSIADLWTALGGELKPSLDLVVTVPFDLGRGTQAGPPVLEEPRIETRASAGDAPRTRRRKGTPRDTPQPEPATVETPSDEAQETVEAGTERQPGRTLRIGAVRPK